ncbi:S-layer homology domain-containing protein [Paenibacillus sp. YYML68]|uniref:S-layer homology domain-containing protein n=1 Tax=Paenibacillus sp. YYML68 TaxID=2909250 RepID=UPI002490C9B6|nr:S-layer homology domain-containing protein [Paenibacillus sp. YYML68]
MNKLIAVVLAIMLALAIVPIASQASAVAVTLQVPGEVKLEQELLMTGASADSDVVLSIRSASGELVYFDTQKSVSGQYHGAIKVPSTWAVGTYEVAVVSGGTRVAKSVTVQTSDNGVGNDNDNGNGDGGSTPASGSGIPGAPAQEAALNAAGNSVSVQLSAADVNGVSTAVVQADQLKKYVDVFKSAAASSKSTPALQLKIEGNAQSKQVVLQLPKEAAALLVDSGVQALVIDTPLGSMAFDQKSLQALNKKDAGELRIGASKVDPSTLPSSAQSAIDDRPVLDLTVSIGGAAVPDFGGGTVKVGIPYAPAASEDHHALVIYYIADNGQMTTVANGQYDQASGTMTFGAKHFSHYGVGFKKVSFEDVSGWSKDYITYMAARGIVQGSGAGQFAPAKAITRAEVLAILARMSGDTQKPYEAGLFTDVDATDWYAGAVQWGSSASIVQGTGEGVFNPNGLITREELAVMISRFAAHAGYTLPKTNALHSFADSGTFSAWAKLEIAALQQAGIVNGMEGNVFRPQGTASREEAAKMLAVLLQGMSK